MTILVNEQLISEELQNFIDKVLVEAEEAFTVFRETNTITANGTVGFIERVAGPGTAGVGELRRPVELPQTAAGDCHRL